MFPEQVPVGEACVKELPEGAPGGLDPTVTPEELGLVAAMLPAYVKDDRQGLLETFVNAGPETALGAMELLFAITTAVLLNQANSR